ncbi:acyl-phosphate glycerol 3-phosphate acyltransferase [Bacillus sp. FJAT-42376]|uniref:lysophospholipid acyltransferase family protein n=1 Tax=Bacillus sp. FJAT-42376 TaxID=2014076 RepID=UPI000F50606A|nr:lysophospholipid acyltransferase family protein [Bacillus sp. FJAT-42376]AZB42301.1 acyl-phosphate glycerol 3-phosphate acyltransferase [Bacillus sp. FJAT-42376]
MIEASKSKWFDFGFSKYVNRLFKQHFRGIFIMAPSALPDHALWCSNHSSWWDGLVLHYLNRTVLKHDFHVMMHEKGLKDFPYFRKMGAFSVNRDHPREIIHSVQYAGTLLNEGKSAAIFPQGDEKHLEQRPLGFLSGIIAIAEKSPDTPILPIALYYSFGAEKKQELYIQIGEPLAYSSLTGSRKEKTYRLEELFTVQLDGLRAKVISGKTGDFRNVL